MEKLINYIEKELIKEEYSSEIKDKIELGDDLCSISLIKSIINNWYYYVNAHNEGTNQQKFSPKVIYSFRNSLKDLLSGKSEQDNYRMHNQKLKQFTNDFYKKMYSIKPNEFDKQIESLKDYAKELSVIDKELNSKNKETINIMNSITNIKKYNIDLYNELIKLHCKATYNGKLLYDGYYNDNYKTNKDKSCIVLEFTLPNNKKYMCLEEENKNINKLKNLINNFDDIYNDYKLYNEAVTLASNLPLYNICEDKSIIRKGDSIVKIYENINV